METVEIVPSQIERAQQVDAEVISILTWKESALEEADNKSAKLARLLKEVSELEYYRALGFQSYDRWLMDRFSRFSRLRRTQSYKYLMVARHLLPHVSDEHFERMGINKAGVLAEAVKKTGLKPTVEIVEAATDRKTTETVLREKVAVAFKLPNQPIEPGRPYDLGVLGTVWMLPDEWGDFQRALDLADITDPVLPNDASDSARLKDRLLKLSGEFISTYGPEGVADGI